ncbi:hypothetical protein V8E53_014295 [Lactarius tabidus]
MHKEDSRCNDFIEKTATAWSEDAVALILFAVQRDNVKLCVKAALNVSTPVMGSISKM